MRKGKCIFIQKEMPSCVALSSVVVSKSGTPIVSKTRYCTCNIMRFLGIVPDYEP